MRLAANRLDPQDYVHGPVIQYLLLGGYLLMALVKTAAGQINGADSFIRWYIEHPEELRHIGRFLMSVGGAATISASMFATHGLSRSRSQARFAALLLLSMPLFHHSSWYIKEDLWAALFGILVAAAAYRRGPVILVGTLWGVAIAAKYTAVALAPGLVAILATNEQASPSYLNHWLKNCARVAAAAAATFVIANPYALVRFGSSVAQLREIISIYFAGDYTVGDARPPILAALVVREFLPFGVGAATLLCSCGTLALGGGKILRRHFALVIAPAAVIALLAISRSGFSRTLTPALPWLVVFASMVWPLLDGLRPRFMKAALCCLVAALAVAQVAGLYRYVTAVDTRELAKAYVERSVPADAVILLEGFHSYVADAGPSVRANVIALRAEQEEKLGKGATGRLNRMQQSAAAADPGGRFETIGMKDFALSGMDQLDRADVVITSKWPSIYPEARAYNIPEDSSQQAVAIYEQGRRAFHASMEEKGFRLLRKFTPTLRARWSFIDRPDPAVFGPGSWLGGGEKVAGPEIAIYSRSDYQD